MSDLPPRVLLSTSNFSSHSCPLLSVSPPLSLSQIPLSRERTFSPLSLPNSPPGWQRPLGARRRAAVDDNGGHPPLWSTRIQPKSTADGARIQRGHVAGGQALPGSGNRVHNSDENQSNSEKFRGFDKARK